MKIRTNYVSNSSSSSFVIHGWSSLSDKLKYKLENYNATAKKILKDNPDLPDNFFGYLDDEYCPWEFYPDDDTDTCDVCTTCDNFNMKALLSYLGVPFRINRDGGVQIQDELLEQ